MADLNAQSAPSASNHGRFVSAVAQLTNGWVREGLITAADRRALRRAASVDKPPKAPKSMKLPKSVKSEKSVKSVKDARSKKAAAGSKKSSKR